MNPFDWNSATDSERLAYNAGFAAGSANPRAEKALARVARYMGHSSASYDEFADYICRRFDGLREALSLAKRVRVSGGDFL